MTKEEFLQEVNNLLPDNNTGEIDAWELRYLFGAIAEKNDIVDFAENMGLVLWYGVEWNKTVASSALTRIGNMELHKLLPIQNKMKGCLQLDDGTVNYYLHPDNWSMKADGTPSDLTGADGQVMVEIPEHYRKFENDGNMQRVKISAYHLPGFSKVGKFYHGAYESALDRTNLALASVKNMSAQFRGGNNNEAWDGTVRSLLGKACTGFNVNQAREYARQRGEGWEQRSYNQLCIVKFLYLVEYANRNSQLPFNISLTAEGYKQGGLGNGVTTLDATLTNNYNGRYPFIPVGHTNSLGNKSGEVAFTMPAEYAASTIVQVCRYRGIENIFGHAIEFTEGYVRTNLAGQYEFRYTDNPAWFHVAYTNNWELIPGTFGGGYISQIQISDEGIISQIVFTGSSNTFFCDNYAGTSVASQERALYIHGGASSHGTLAGLFCGFIQAHEIYTFAHLTSRLTYRP